jgi:Predicted soluble lytic transglycosylase fused to an ABC-type amino acid-binding protein
MNVPVQNYDSIFQRYGAQFDIDWRLLKAVAMRESGLDELALNEEGAVGGRASRGLMQVLCPHSLNVQGWSGQEPVGGCESLFDPDVNVKIGAQILRWNLDTYGFPRGVAIYNNWSQRTQPVNGPFTNQNYVNAILGYYKQYGGDVSALASRYGSGAKG